MFVRLALAVPDGPAELITPAPVRFMRTLPRGILAYLPRTAHVERCIQPRHPFNCRHPDVPPTAALYPYNVIRIALIVYILIYIFRRRFGTGKHPTVVADTADAAQSNVRPPG